MDACSQRNSPRLAQVQRRASGVLGRVLGAEGGNALEEDWSFWEKSGLNGLVYDVVPRSLERTCATHDHGICWRRL